MNSKNEEDKFEIKAYDKIELAMLYCPDRTADAAVKTFWRWIKLCDPLVESLAVMGYNWRRHRFLKQEVELIVRYLGEP